MHVIRQSENRLNDFFNTAAFCAPPTVGNGYGFGDTARGIARGPGQYSADIALMRQFSTNILRENSYFQFRAEAYNALNTPRFSATTAVQGATPITQVGTLNFDQITAVSVAPRLFQLGSNIFFEANQGSLEEEDVKVPHLRDGFCTAHCRGGCSNHRSSAVYQCRFASHHAPAREGD